MSSGTSPATFHSRLRKLLDGNLGEAACDYYDDGSHGFMRFDNIPVRRLIILKTDSNKQWVVLAKMNFEVGGEIKFIDIDGLFGEKGQIYAV